MTVLGRGRGAFRVVDVDTSNGKGVLVSIAGGGNPVGSSSLVTSFSVQQAENYAVSQCLNGAAYLYTFGHDPQRSQFSLGITSFLNSCNGDVGTAVSEAIAAYNKGRVSQSKALSSLTVGTGAFNGYLVGQGIDVVNPELGIIQTTYTFIALNAHGE